MSASEVFGNAGQVTGTEIWRIEDLAPKEWPRNQHGTFYSGDSYIVLRTSEDKHGKKQWDIHFWLGSATSQDESGTAAIMSVELDDMLGGTPVQHREVESHESKLFLSYFKGGMQCLDGGVDSGFNHVEPESYEPRLLQVKGKRDVRITQVPLTTSSMNEGDVFILDMGLKLYQWNGAEANKHEKFKGMETMNRIKDVERHGNAACVYLDKASEEDTATFWNVVGDASWIKSAVGGGEDEDAKPAPPKLFRVSDDSGTIETTLVAEGTLERAMLDSKDVFLVDSGSALFVWVGKQASKEERRNSMSQATAYMDQENRPSWMNVTRVSESNESRTFTSLFREWSPPVVVDVSEPKPNTNSLYMARAEQAEASSAMLDDGSGKITVWRIEDMQKVPVPDKMVGHFYAGDSYIVLYEYKVKNRDFQVIYFWQGRDSSVDEKTSSALLSVALDDEMTAAGKDPMQVRVVMGKEPRHFHSIFTGSMVIHHGGHASGFNNSNEKDVYDTDGVSLFQIRGTNSYNAHALQVEEEAASLNSGDCFVLISPKKVFVWKGKGSTEDERSFAVAFAEEMQGDRTTIWVPEGEEGGETDEFWTYLGGKGPYPSGKVMLTANVEPRLFRCSNRSGHFEVEEIVNFAQEDLTNDDVFLLDTFDEVYLWIGNECNRLEKKESFQAALDFVANTPDGRSKDTPVLQVDSGFEPPLFTVHFLGWDDDFFRSGDPYEAKLRELQASGDTEGKVPVSLSRVTSIKDADGFRDPADGSFPYPDVRDRKIDHMDPNRRHEYLSTDEFAKVFGMDLATFNVQKGWKQAQLKKKAGLF